MNLDKQKKGLVKKTKSHNDKDLPVHKRPKGFHFPSLNGFLYSNLSALILVP